MTTNSPAETERSRTWSQQPTARGLINRAFLRTMGFSAAMTKRPIIGICNNWSDLNPCNSSLKEVAESVKRGVYAAGGLPLEFNTISIHENFFDISTLLYRNLLAMETEELLVGHPLDGVVLLSGCDKTPAAQLMAAASANIPAILFPAGPSEPGSLHGRKIGCWDGRRLWAQAQAGEVDGSVLETFEAGMNATLGTCCMFGTAGTMAAIGEALGMSLPGTATLPAVHRQRMQLAEEAGAQIVRLVKERITPRMIMTSPALHNALCVLMATGGSQNAIVHLLAIARRLGLPLDLKDFDAIGRKVPVVCNVMPAGEALLDDFDRAGGVPAVLKQIRPHLALDAMTVTGKTMKENLESAVCLDANIIRPLESPVYAEEPMAVVYGTLAPAGAIVKAASASAGLLRHKSRALVFESHKHYMECWQADELAWSPDTILVMRNEGPVANGMPEMGGHMYIPKRLSAAGVRDMVRITDARMSGTVSGAIVVHVAPEAAVGGPLGQVKTGDEIELNVAERRLDLLVSNKELKARQASLPKRPAPTGRGFRALHARHVLQAFDGCDLDFMLPERSGRNG